MKIRELKDVSVYSLTYSIIDNEPTECVNFIELFNNDDNIIQLEYINNSEVIVDIDILPKGEIARLCKCKIHVVNNHNKETIYEELWYITRNIDLNADALSNYVLKKDLVYRDMLLTTIYYRSYRDLFLEPDTLDERDSLVYQHDDMCYIGSNGSYFTQSVIKNDTNNYRDFLVHIESENDNYRVEYSLDNGSNWNVINSDEDIHVDEDIVNLDIKVTLTGDNTIYSFGVMYDKQE